MDTARSSSAQPHPQLKQIESLFGPAATVQATLITEVTTENGALPPPFDTLTRSRRRSSTELPEAATTTTTVVEQSLVRDLDCDLHGDAPLENGAANHLFAKRRDSLSLAPNITNGTTNGDRIANGIVPQPSSAADVAPVPPPRRPTKTTSSHHISAAASQENAPTPLSQFVAKRTPFPVSSVQTSAAAATPAPVLRSFSAYTLNRAAQLRMQRDSVDRSPEASVSHKSRNGIQRGQSFAGADRKRSSWTPSAVPATNLPHVPPQLQHPSAFPSMLRGSPAPQTQSSWDVRGIRRVSAATEAPAASPATALGPKSVSTTNLRRRESLSTPRRRDSAFISNNLQNGSGDGTGNGYPGGSSTQLSSAGVNDLRRQSFGGGLYLRPAAAVSTSSLTRRDSFGSQNLRGQRSGADGAATAQLNNGGSSVFLRSDSAGQGNLVRRDRYGGSQTTLRRDSINTLMGSNRSINLNSMTSSASSAHQRRDSFGSQNLAHLVRRDSVSSQRASVPRDYVSSGPCAIRSHNMMNGLFDRAPGDSVDGHYAAATVRSVGKPANSILRKDSFKTSKKHVSYEDDAAHDTVDAAATKTTPSPLSTTSNLLAEVQQQLTAANLSKHSTIMEENLLSDERQKKGLAKKLSFEETNHATAATRRERTNSTGSTGSASYANAGRRISMDSLDARRNSWTTPVTIFGGARRGSQTSTVDAEDLEKEVRAVLEYYVV